MKKLILFLLSLGFVIFSFVPTGYELYKRNFIQPDRYFELVHNFPTDYNFYLSRIRQGIEGRTSAIEQYTSEPHRGSYIHVFYLFLGWLGRWSRVPWERGGDVYHVARFVFGMLLMMLIAEYVKKSFGFMDKHSEKTFFGDAQQTRNRSSTLSRSLLSEDSPQKKIRNVKIYLWRTFSAPQNASPHASHYYWSLIAFLLAVTVSTWPKLVAVVNNQVVQATLTNIAHWRLGGYMAWWSVIDSLQRITHIPHLLLGQALLLFLIMMVSDPMVLKKPGNWVFLGVLGFLLGIVLPPALLFVYVTIVVLIGIEFIYDKPKKLSSWLVSHVTPRVVIGIVSIPSLIYLMLMTSFYPWKRLADVDIIRPLPFEYLEYFKAVGPVLPLGLLGLAIALKKKEKAMLPSVAWVIAWLFLLGAFRFIPQQSPLRFSEMIPHVPLGVLTAYLFLLLSRSGKTFFGDAQQIKHSLAEVANRNFDASPVSLAKIRQLFDDRKSRSQSEAAQNFIGSPQGISLVISNWVFIIPVTLILLGGGVMYSSLLWQKDFIDMKLKAAYPLVPTGGYVMYPLKSFILAMKFIQDNTSRGTVILSETTAGNYMPVYSGNTVYVGHDNTVDAERKHMRVFEFFSAQMTVAQAKNWLNNNNLHIIFFGPQEREDGGVADLAKVYPFLDVAYQNDYVTLYKVK